MGLKIGKLCSKMWLKSMYLSCVLLLLMGTNPCQSQLDVLSSILRGRSLTPDETKQVMNLLQEIKSLVTENNQNYSVDTDVANSGEQIEKRIEEFAKHTNQKIDLMLENVASLRLFATEQLKSIERRVEIMEEQVTQVVSRQKQQDLIHSSESTVLTSESQPPPINSYLLSNILSASLPENPQLMSVESNTNQLSGMERTGDSEMETRLQSLETHVSKLTSDFDKRSTDIAHLSDNVTDLLENPKLKCGCPVNNMQTLLDFINDELNSFQQTKASISRNEERIGILNDKVKLTDSENAKLSEEISEVERDLEGSSLATAQQISALGNQLLSLGQEVNTFGVALSDVANSKEEKHWNHTELCVYPYKRAGNNGCFHVSMEEMLTWNEARRSCNDLQGDLAAPDDFVEFKKFLSKLKLSRSYSYWIGGNDVTKEGDWRWVNEKPIDMGVEVWESGQPNQGKSSNCMEIRPTVKYAASDQRCSLKRHFVCQQYH